MSDLAERLEREACRNHRAATVFLLTEAATVVRTLTGERDAAYADLETLREWTKTHGATHAANLVLRSELREARDRATAAEAALLTAKLAQEPTP